MKQTLATLAPAALAFLGLATSAAAQDIETGRADSTAPDDAAIRQKESAAESAVKEWLYYIDNGEYTTAWTNAATMFKNQVTPTDWQDTVSKAREPFGRFRSRSRRAARYATALPGAPDGEYVLLQFDAAFENKAAAVETVAAVLEEGLWRVTGYYIK